MQDPKACPAWLSFILEILQMQVRADDEEKAGRSGTTSKRRQGSALHTALPLFDV
jgi:hypothetical protein